MSNISISTTKVSINELKTDISVNHKPFLEDICVYKEQDEYLLTSTRNYELCYLIRKDDQDNLILIPNYYLDQYHTFYEVSEGHRCLCIPYDVLVNLDRRTLKNNKVFRDLQVNRLKKRKNYVNMLEQIPYIKPIEWKYSWLSQFKLNQRYPSLNQFSIDLKETLVYLSKSVTTPLFDQCVNASWELVTLEKKDNRFDHVIYIQLREQEQPIFFQENKETFLHLYDDMYINLNTLSII